MGRRKRTHEEFVEIVKQLGNNEYEVLGDYQNSNTEILTKHNVCNYIWNVKPANFLNGQRCPKCSNRLRKTTEEFKQEILDIVGIEYEVLSEYQNRNTNIKMKHNVCGFEYQVAPANFLNRNRRCPKCSGKVRKDTEFFKQEVFELVKNEYEVLGEYKNIKNKILMKHSACGHEYLVSPNKFLMGRRCPKCKPTSRGERAIEKWLIQNNIEFVPQFWFNDCRYELPLPFDFAIFENRKIRLLIEFDGRHHYESIDFWGGKKELEKQIKKDRIKNNYCKTNNIPLLRIPYWKYEEIHTILSENLNISFLERA